MFLRVELWRVGREGINMQPGLIPDEFANHDAFVDSAVIPYEHDGSSQMAQEVAEEIVNFQTRDVFRVETDIQTQPVAFRGDGDPGNGRYLVSLVTMPEDWSVTSGRPCPMDVWNEKESAFVNENEMGAKFSGFFLYEARCISSSARWPSRPAARLAVPVSDSSNSIASSLTTRCDRDGNERQNVCEPVWQYAEASTNLWSSLRQGLLSPEAGAISSSVAQTAVAAVRGLDLIAVLCARVFDGTGPSVPRNSNSSSICPRQNDTSCPHATSRWLDVFVSPTVGSFLGVSYATV